MRGVLTVVSLLIVLAVIGLLSKKQMSTVMPTGLPPEIKSQGNVPPALSNTPVQKLPDQFKKSLDEAMQKPRSENADQ